MGSVGERRRNAAPTLLHPPGMRAQRDRSANHSNPFWGATLLLPPCPWMGTASVPRSVLWDPQWVQPCAPQAKLCSPNAAPAEPRGATRSAGQQPWAVIMPTARRALAKEDGEQEELTATPPRSALQTPTEHSVPSKPPPKPPGSPKAAARSAGCPQSGEFQPCAGDKTSSTTGIHRSIPPGALLYYTVSMATACTVPPRSPHPPTPHSS